MKLSGTDQRLEIGSFIGPYKIMRLMGKGGMGEVYEAYENHLQRKVALKIISPEMLNSALVIEQFFSEGRALAQINHPNIVTIYQLGEQEGVHYIAMEYIDGESLDKVIKKKLPTTKVALNIFYKILLGVRILHQQNIIHRDLKPKNIMVTKENKIKIVDFGIAEFASENFNETAIGENLLGSILYLSPELITKNHATVQSDIWSLGILFYKLLTGKNPFFATKRKEVIESILNENLTFPSYKNLIISEDIKSIILKMCHKDTEERYKNIDDIISDLKQEQTKDSISFLNSILYFSSFLFVIIFIFFLLNQQVFKISQEVSNKTITNEDNYAQEKVDKSEINPKTIPEHSSTQTTLQSAEDTSLKSTINSVAERILLKKPILLKPKFTFTMKLKPSYSQRELASNIPPLISFPEFKWRSVANADFYKLQISSNSSFKKIIFQEKILSTTYIWKKLTPGIFYWRVEAINKNSPPSGYSQVGLLKVLLPRPKILKNKINIKLTPVIKKHGIDIEWLSSPLAQEYLIQLTPLKGVLEKTIYYSNKPLLKLSMDKPSKFKATVTALDSSRNPSSLPSKPSTVEISLSKPLLSPRLLVPSDNTIVPSQGTMITPIVCRWNKTQHTLRYTFQVLDKNKKVIKESKLNENQIILTLPLTKGRYSWRVKAVGEEELESEWSATRHFIID
ncbi:MAG: serine/threonine protein kinase [Bdellovibrionales bacterium]|nr:serine/threonine protein kinase [Bdellovibrionales bacterium]